jgi:hypothetical protein
MNEKCQNNRDGVSPVQDICPSTAVAGHPAWCDPERCTADPASQAHGYRSGVGGEHRSVPITLNLTTAMLPVWDGLAWLSVACAPWSWAVFLRVQVGDVELSMAVDDAAPVLGGLSALLASALAREGVIR